MVFVHKRIKHVSWDHRRSQLENEHWMGFCPMKAETSHGEAPFALGTVASDLKPRICMVIVVAIWNVAQ
jgi:hypothetical protein